VHGRQQSYVYRGDRVRRNERIKKLLLVAGLAVSVALIPHERPRSAEASAFSGFSFGREAKDLRSQLDATRGELVESEFNPHAVSSVGAVGLTQLMPATARWFDHTITREKLYDPRTNLRLGFRYLRSLIDQYHGDLRLALLVYNRGPEAVETLRSLGVDPRNGYDEMVMKGYTGNGLVY